MLERRTDLDICVACVDRLSSRVNLWSNPTTAAAARAKRITCGRKNIPQAIRGTKKYAMYPGNQSA